MRNQTIAGGVRRGVLLAAGALAALALFAGGVKAEPGPDGASGAPGDEACLASRINSFRQSHGVGPLSTMSGLVSIGRSHSAEMAAAGRWYHSSDLGSKVRPLGAVKWGENVGWATDCSYMHNFFVNSTVHRNNMLNPVFTHQGVGVVASDGKIWVTEIFIRSASATAPAPAASSSPAPQPLPPSPSARPQTPAGTPAAPAPSARPSVKATPKPVAAASYKPNPPRIRAYQD
ncbi:MAG: CAP domain-containing protein, partial [Actinomycetota bacterium]